MAAINSIVARDAMNMLSKRAKSWPAKNVGVMVVFCIVGTVAIVMIALFVQKMLTNRKNKRQASSV